MLSPLLSSPPSHQGHPRPAHGDPVLLFLSSWPICSLRPVFQSFPLDVYQMSCVPPTTFSLHLLPPSHARSCMGGPQSITRHDHNLPLSSLQGSFPLSAAVPLLGPSSSSPYLSCFFPYCGRESKSPSTSMCHTFILIPSESIQILHAFFHPLHFYFQPVHHRASVKSPIFLFCFNYLFSFCLGRQSLRVLIF